MNKEKLQKLKDQFEPAAAAAKRGIKIMFVPDAEVTSAKQLNRIYGNLLGSEYETVVFVEKRIVETNKKIPMPTCSYFDTEYGAVAVNDALRNEFCDEDDDFFIDDVAFGQDMQIYRHLPYLMAALGDFSVVSVPVCDDDPAIVREVNYVLSEIMGGRNFLLVVACSLLSDKDSSAKLRKLVIKNDISNIMNLLNSGALPVSGSSAFLVGILTADYWGLKATFLDFNAETESSLTGFAYLPNK